MATGEQSAGEPSGVFGRQYTEWLTAGHQRVPTGLGEQLRFALWYPRTADFRTFLGGGLLLVSLIFVVTVPAAYGYLLAVTRNAANGRPAPTFGDWPRQYGQGLVAIVFGFCLFFGLFVVAYLPLAAVSAVAGAAMDTAAGFAGLAAMYATPAIVAAYGVDRRYLRFQARRSATWAVSLNYLVTAVVVSVALLVGYFLTLLSIITIVGPIFVGLYILMAIAAFVGVRYGTFEGTALLTATELVDPVTPDAVVHADDDRDSPPRQNQQRHQPQHPQDAQQPPSGQQQTRQQQPQNRRQPPGGDPAQAPPDGRSPQTPPADHSAQAPPDGHPTQAPPDGRSPQTPPDERTGQAPPPEHQPNSQHGGTDHSGTQQSGGQRAHEHGSGEAGSPTPPGPSSREETPERDPGVYYDDEEGRQDGPIRYHEGEHVTEDAVSTVRVATPEPELGDDATDAFLRAARQWANISQNEPIATVVAVGDETDPHLAFEIGDTSLKETLQSLSGAERTSLLVDVAESLRLGRLYNHRHGHLTPDAVHVRFDDGAPQATVSEWGLRREVGSAVGDDTIVTPYTAPEQVGDGRLGEAVDVYQLGALGCYIFTGRPPVDGGEADRETLADAIESGPQRSVADDDRVPPGVAAILDQALSADPEQRQDSVRAVENALERTLG